MAQMDWEIWLRLETLARSSSSNLLSISTGGGGFGSSLAQLMSDHYGKALSVGFGLVRSAPWRGTRRPSVCSVISQ